MDLEAREAALKAFANEDVAICFVCGIATEGVDCPRVNCVFFGDGRSSESATLRFVRRWLRLCMEHARELSPRVFLIT